MLQNTFHLSLSGLMLVAEIAVVLAAATVLLWRGGLNPPRRTVMWLALGWGVLVTVEYWILGPSSYVMLEDEGEVTVPYLIYLTGAHIGGLFAHGFGSGLDTKAMMGSNNAFISLEYILFILLPAWLAVAVHKAMVVAVAFSGAYLLARRGGGADRATAFALACWFTVAHEYSAAATVTHGLGYALPALAIYVFVCRLDRPRYFAPAISVGALFAISCSVTHSVFALAPAVFVVWLFTGARRPGRFLTASALGLAMLVLNWIEVVQALVQNAPFSYRGAETIERTNAPLWSLVDRFFQSTPEGGLILALGLALLFVGSDPRRWRAVAIAAVPILLGPVLIAVPWHETPLGFLAGIDFNYIAFALVGGTVLTGGWASTIRGRAMRTPVMATVALSLALGVMASWKVFNAAQWLGRGGQSQYWVYANLAEPDWAPDHLFRTATVPYRIFPNTVAAYGLETVDSLVNIVPAPLAFFFRYGLPDGNTSSVHNYVTSAKAVDVLCCAPIHPFGPRELAQLRMANVEYVLSVLPLEGEGLALVSGPPDGAIPPRRGTPMTAKLAGFARMLFERRNLYVYAVADALPRAFVARAAAPAPMPADPHIRDYHDAIAAAANARAVVPTGKSAAPDGALTRFGEGRVEAVREIRDGYEIDVTFAAPGVLVVNTTWTPFWRASLSDGTPLAALAVNGIHTAIPVPRAGTQKILLRYARPTLF